MEKKLFTEKEAGRYLGLSRSFLRQARMNGMLAGRRPGPRFLKVGNRSIRYKVSDLDAWIDQHDTFDSVLESRIETGETALS